MQNEMEMIALNGVYYAEIKNKAENWRIGSLVADWPERLALFPSQLEKKKLIQLENMGIFPSPAEKPDALAVMCAGLGAAWPGMGRELYDNFPVARAAMDEIASLADWDVLALMDEKDVEIINSSRYQIPYLFLLEYAQWRELQWLGLKPDMICGHSLGELVALCLAGVYPVEGAWLLLDTRARHMAHLEKMGNGNTGMLVVSADRSKIAEVLHKWPSMAISNANTPHQFVLGGPRPDLLEARRELRRNRIPAFMLPINLAFHNPEMRILRDLSTRRLNALEMHPPLTPFLSCVTADLYPDTQELISRAIADLDENTVDWTASVKTMREKYGIRNFMELGPQDVLCGLTRENDPDAFCIPADLKNRETNAMRSACAMLFAKGFLPYQKLAALKAPSGKNDWKPFPNEETGKSDWTAFGDIPAQELEIIINLLAQAGNCEKEKLNPEMDLKYDLGLRSSNFPLLIQEAEKRLQKTYEIENIFNLSTVGDLAIFLAGKNQRANDIRQHPPDLRQNAVFGKSLSLWRWEGNKNFTHQKINIANAGPMRKKRGPILLLCPDPRLLDNLWEGIACPGQIFALPGWQMESCARLAKAGATLVPLNIKLTGNSQPEIDELTKFSQKYGAPAGIFLALPAVGLNEFIAEQILPILKSLFILHDAIPSAPWLCLLQILKKSDQNQAFDPAQKKIDDFFSIAQKSLKDKTDSHCICWLDSRDGSVFQNRNEGGDLLALNLIYGNSDCELWEVVSNNETDSSIFCLDPDGPFYEEKSAAKLPRAGSWQAGLQFSLFAEPECASHGIGGQAWSQDNETPIKDYSSSWLSAGTVASLLLEAGNQPLPWLMPVTLQDFDLSLLPILPNGITRECQTAVLERPWLIQNGDYVRLARIEMSCRELLQNGRHSANWKNIANGLGSYGHVPLSPKPLWQSENQFIPISEGSIGKFYDQINFGQPWRRLAEASTCPASKNILRFVLNLSKNSCGIAPKRDWRYSVFSQLVESLAQAAFFSAMQSSADNFTDPCKWRNEWMLATIGYLQFDWTSLSTAKQFVLELRLAWRASNMLRYDAQIMLDKDKVALAMTHLELEKREAEKSG